MSEPEIARRCTACGVSVRDRAMFCPQCGNPIPEAAATTVTTATDTVIDPTPAPTQPPPVRHADGGVKARVEKLRHVSSVVIDQAAYDPSLRFLLVAAALLLLLLVLLIMRTVIGWMEDPQGEILQTVAMTEMEHLDVRTVTLGLSLLDCK